mgnify:CR=1 FL=1
MAEKTFRMSDDVKYGLDTPVRDLIGEYEASKQPYSEEVLTAPVQTYVSVPSKVLHPMAKGDFPLTDIAGRTASMF